MEVEPATESPTSRIPFSFRSAVSAVRRSQTATAAMTSPTNNSTATNTVDANAAVTNVSTNDAGGAVAMTTQDTATTSTPPTRLSRFHSFGGSSRPNNDTVPEAITRSETDKRLAEAVSELTAKYSNLLDTHNSKLDENSRLQGEINRLQVENRRLLDSAMQHQIALENEKSAGDALTSSNMRLMDELASERRLVQRMAREREDLEADFKMREADFASVVEEDSRRTTKALEVMRSKVESKSKSLEVKIDEINRLTAHIFSLESAIQRVEAALPDNEAVAAALKGLPNRIHVFEPPRNPIKKSNEAENVANADAIAEAVSRERELAEKEKEALLAEIEALREIVAHHTMDDNGWIEFAMSSSAEKLYLKCIEAVLRRSERGGCVHSTTYRATQLDLLDVVELLDEALMSLQTCIVADDLESSALSRLLSHLSGSQKQMVMNKLIAMPTQEFTHGPKNVFLELTPSTSQTPPTPSGASATNTSWRRPSKTGMEGITTAGGGSGGDGSGAIVHRRAPPPSPCQQASPDAAVNHATTLETNTGNVTPFNGSPWNAEANIFDAATLMDNNSDSEQRTLAALESLAYDSEANYNNNGVEQLESYAVEDPSFTGQQTSYEAVAVPSKRRVSMNPFSNLLYELNPELYEQQKAQETAPSEQVVQDASSGEENATDDESDNNPWSPVLDAASGNIYYFNRATMETTWNRPI